MSTIITYSAQQGTTGPPISAIIGGVIGGTVLIAISSIIYLDVRRRKFRKIHKKRLRAIKADTVIRPIVVDTSTSTSNPLTLKANNQSTASWRSLKL